MVDIDAMLDAVEAEAVKEKKNKCQEKEIEIIVNKNYGENQLYLQVYPDNTMGEILQMYKTEMGTIPDNPEFMNARTCKMTADQNCTVAELGLMEGDTLNVFTNTKVA